MVKGLINLKGSVRNYATEEGCERVRGILHAHGIEATVSVGKNGRFTIHAPVHGARHTCHWPGCDKEVPPAMWGCKTHWLSLPKRLRDRIWATYRPGQEIMKTPSPEYVTAAREVQQWIADQDQ